MSNILKDTPPTPEVLPERELPTDPGVERAMAELQLIIDEAERNGGIEHTDAGEPILPEQLVETWANRMRYGNNIRGTLRTETNDSFVYFKGNFDLSSQERSQIDSRLALARQLTALGAIHPTSRWHVAERNKGGYRLFVVSPRLEVYEPGTGEEWKGNLPGSRAAIHEWYRRVDPNFDPDQPLASNSLVRRLNEAEASHGDNWGRDETGTLFPVDVQVLILGDLLLDASAITDEFDDL